ncbi:fam-l protein [Plasmodium malariae]|uniref:Fam-l protein n=1 Tax=Plasmodium malariae TaxID=5858 RepID=A0A1D3JHS3_PLAMA|nr:fam-l protein [Plasmodium malariae]SBT85905.1 fam-l protein [Plasmodium malariae]
MEKKTKLLLFIIIAAFIVLNWTCHFNNDCMFNKYIDENCEYARKLDSITYRLLSKYKKDNDSNVVCLKGDLPNNIVKEKRDVTNNESVVVSKNNQICRNALNNSGGHKQDKRSKSCVFKTKRYSHMEKKIFKELDYMDFLQNSRTISDKIYKKIIFKKFALRLLIPVMLFLLLSLSFFLDFYGGYGLRGGLFKILNLYAEKLWYNSFHIFLKSSFLSSFTKSMGKVKINTLKKTPLSNGQVKKEIICGSDYVFGFISFLIYFSTFFILGFTIILAVFYYHKKVKKYEKIKFRKR